MERQEVGGVAETIARDLMRNPAATPRFAKGNNYIIAIGINKYKHLPRLHNAIRDCQMVIDVLTRRYSFPPLEDGKSKFLFTCFDEEATKHNIINTFRKVQRTIKEDDNLLIYYAGHGTYDRDWNEGFWIPTDANFDPNGIIDYTDQYIPNNTIVNIVRNIRARHIFLVMDSCYSGSLFSTTRALPSYEERFEGIPSRWGLASGMLESVDDGFWGDGSPFACHFVHILETNNRPTLLVADFIFRVVQAVGEAGHRQQPAGERINGAGREGLGQFVFRLKASIVQPDGEAVTEDDYQRVEPSISPTIPSPSPKPQMAPLIFHFSLMGLSLLLLMLFLVISEAGDKGRGLVQWMAIIGAGTCLPVAAYAWRKGESRKGTFARFWDGYCKILVDWGDAIVYSTALIIWFGVLIYHLGWYRQVAFIVPLDVAKQLGNSDELSIWRKTGKGEAELLGTIENQGATKIRVPVGQYYLFCQAENHTNQIYGASVDINFGLAPASITIQSNP